MSAGESIKKGFSVAGQSLNLVAVLFLFGFIFGLTGIFMPPPASAATQAGGLGYAVLSIGFLLFSIFFQAGTMGYIRDKIKQGSAAFSSFTASGSRYYLKFLLFGLLMMVGFVAAALVVTLLAVLGGKVHMYLAVAVGSVLGGLGIYVFLLTFMTPYVLVNSEHNVVAATKASIAFVRKNLASLLLLTLIIFAVGFAIGLLLGLGVAALGGETAAIPVKIGFVFLNSLVNAYIGVFVAAAYMHFYLGKASS